MSKATQSLAALSSMQTKVVEVDNAATALDRLKPDPAAPDVGDDGEARFGTPEAIATAVVASVLLGPVGGILVGGAQGWLKKRSDQALLDKLASDQNIFSESADIYTQEIDKFKASATNDNDLQQIGFMRAGLTVAQKFMTSPDADMQAQGVDMMDKVDTAMQTFARTQETQQIAADARDAQLRVELDDRQFDRFTGLLDDFTAQSDPYLLRKQALNTALDAAQNGSPSDMHTAIVMFNKTLDPNSAVLTGEINAIANMGSWLEQSYSFLNSGFNGQKMSSKQRRELGETLLRIGDESTKFQLQREARFSELANDAELPLKYHDNFRLVDDAPASEPVDIPADALESGELEEAVKTNLDKIVDIASSPLVAGEKTRLFIETELDKERARVVDTAERVRDFFTRRPTN